MTYYSTSMLFSKNEPDPALRLHLGRGIKAVRQLAEISFSSADTFDFAYIPDACVGGIAAP